MPQPVKRDSPSKSGRGQARTRLARRAVVDAARALFLERGYVATTIEAISEHSDVPSATVYRLFSSKLGILRATHASALKDMKGRWKHPISGMGWYRAAKRNFADLPED
jgi:AcrR family transcriptional regulator